LSKNKSSTTSAAAPQEYCVFEYLYRDASNYKAFGALLLTGHPTQEEIAALRACLDSGEYFVAEQVGIPAVYKELWELSGGPTEDDHALHEYGEIRVASEDEKNTLPLLGSFSNLLATFRTVKVWDYSLSPNFDIE
jgi:hypothetical protein